MSANATQTMKWLVRREYWENKGGFTWAPIIGGIVGILLCLVGSVISGLFGREHHGGMQFDGTPIDQVAGWGAVGDVMLMGGAALMALVLGFVLFFYLLGSLYDDRRDRSILFWKSMPISDSQMVLSKLAWALLLAPVLSFAFSLVLGVILWFVASVGAAISGVPGMVGIFTASHPFRFLASALVTLPVQMAWSLPAVGWLMLCSSWSRRMPFLWAVVPPIMICAMVSFTDLFPGIDINHRALWWTLAYRPLLSVFPFSWNLAVESQHVQMHGPEDMGKLFDPMHSLTAFATADMWIGVAVGVAMIYVATRLRRWREEG